jgi:hypothetical protein
MKKTSSWRKDNDCVILYFCIMTKCQKPAEKADWQAFCKLF